MFHETTVINYLNQQNMFKEKLLKITEIDNGGLEKRLRLDFEDTFLFVDCDMINNFCVKNLVTTINENLGDRE